MDTKDEFEKFKIHVSSYKMPPKFNKKEFVEVRLPVLACLQTVKFPFPRRLSCEGGILKSL